MDLPWQRPNLMTLRKLLSTLGVELDYVLPEPEPEPELEVDEDAQPFGGAVAPFGAPELLIPNHARIVELVSQKFTRGRSYEAKTFLRKLGMTMTILEIPGYTVQYKV